MKISFMVSNSSFVFRFSFEFLWHSTPYSRNKNSIRIPAIIMCFLYSKIWIFVCSRYCSVLLSLSSEFPYKNTDYKCFSLDWMSHENVRHFQTWGWRENQPRQRSIQADDDDDNTLQTIKSRYLYTKNNFMISFYCFLSLPMCVYEWKSMSFILFHADK